VTDFRARSRAVYLPTDAHWVDFWTGQPVPSGWRNAPAPYDAMPVFIRAGSIVPFGPDVQYVGRSPADPLTLRIYEGADAEFTLYEDAVDL